MKYTQLTLAFLFVSTLCFSQTKEFDIIIGTGFYSTPARKPVNPAPLFSGDFEYHHHKWAFSAGIITSEYFYEYPNSSRMNMKGIHINRGSELQSNFLVKYKIINHDFITLQAGVGAGLITIGREEEIKSPTSFSVLFASNTDLGFPLSLEAYSKISKHFLVGVKFGSFIFPDYPIIGNNVGIQLRYRL